MKAQGHLDNLRGVPQVLILVNVKTNYEHAYWV